MTTEEFVDAVRDEVGAIEGDSLEDVFERVVACAKMEGAYFDVKQEYESLCEDLDFPKGAAGTLVVQQVTKLHELKESLLKIARANGFDGKVTLPHFFALMAERRRPWWKRLWQWKDRKPVAWFMTDYGPVQLRVLWRGRKWCWVCAPQGWFPWTEEVADICPNDPRQWDHSGRIA